MGQTSAFPANPRDSPSATRNLLDGLIRFSPDDIPKGTWQDAEEAARQFYSDLEWSRIDGFTRARILTKAVEFQYSNRDGYDTSSDLNLFSPNPWAAFDHIGREKWPAPTMTKKFTRQQQDAFRKVMARGKTNRLAQRQWGDKFYNNRMTLTMRCKNCSEAGKACERNDALLVCMECHIHRAHPRCENIGYFYVDLASRVLNISLADARALYNIVTGAMEEEDSDYQEEPRNHGELAPLRRRGRPPGKRTAKVSSPRRARSPPSHRPKKRSRTDVNDPTARDTSRRSRIINTGCEPTVLCGRSGDFEDCTTSTNITSSSDVEFVDEPTPTSAIMSAPVVSKEKPSRCPQSTFPIKFGTAGLPRIEPRHTTSNRAQAQPKIPTRRVIAPFTDTATPKRTRCQVNGSISASTTHRQPLANVQNRACFVPNHATTSYCARSPVGGSVNSMGTRHALNTGCTNEVPVSQIGIVVGGQTRGAHSDIGQLQLTIETLQKMNEDLKLRYTALHTLSGKLLQEASAAQSMLEISLPLINEALGSPTEVSRPLRALVEQKQRLRTASLTYQQGIWELDEASLLDVGASGAERRF